MQRINNVVGHVVCVVVVVATWWRICGSCVGSGSRVKLVADDARSCVRRTERGAVRRTVVTFIERLCVCFFLFVQTPNQQPANDERPSHKMRWQSTAEASYTMLRGGWPKWRCRCLRNNAALSWLKDTRRYIVLHVGSIKYYWPTTHCWFIPSWSRSTYMGWGHEETWQMKWFEQFSLANKLRLKCFDFNLMRFSN